MDRSQRVVVFDVGGVLVPPDGALSALFRELDVSQAAFLGAYWGNRHEYDLGGDAAVYWGGVLTRLGRQQEPGLVEVLSELDAQGWSALPPVSAAMLDVVTRAEGVRTALLSNAPVSLARAIRRAPWSSTLDVLVFSADVGLAKPDPRIYVAVDRACGCGPADVVFFDDRDENVGAARAHGWEAHQWQDPQTAMAVLAEHGIG